MIVCCCPGCVIYKAPPPTAPCMYEPRQKDDRRRLAQALHSMRGTAVQKTNVLRDRNGEVTVDCAALEDCVS